MNALLKSVKATTGAKDKLIRESLTQHLSESVKEIQMNQSGENLSGDILNTGSDPSGNLCTVLEAIFLHGLKDSLMHLARKAISSDIDQRPEPSFWSMLLIFSHRQIIDQIMSLQQVTTEVGYCRAWLRIALNDSLLSSYVASMQRDSHVLKQFYKRHAYLRDSELLDVAQNFISGVETCITFSLAINSSLLNYWSNPPLLLAGIWSPPLRSCPISAGVDIARSLDATPTSLNPDVASLISSTSQSSNISGIGQFAALDEGEALKIILSRPNFMSSTKSSSNRNDEKQASNTLHEESRIKDKEIIQEPVEINEKELTEKEFQKSSELESSEKTQDSSGIGNSLSGKCGWSFEKSEDEEMIRSTNSVESYSSEKRNNDGIPFTDHSYNTLVENYNCIGNTYIKTPDLSDVWQRFSDTDAAEKRRPSKTDEQLLDGLGFEVIPASASSTFTVKELNLLVTQLGKIAREQGLDYQKYVCSDCGNALGISFTKPSSVCAFSGEYFCEDCMSTTLFIIPARVIYNWDFRRYSVSRKAATFLTDFKHQPCINLKTLNPNIYAAIEEMAGLQTLRVQLNFLRAYLYTCREPVIEQLQRKVWPREYIYECVHQYSISDLEQIPGGVLAADLRSVVDFARAHVISCWLCSQKGYICEVCKKTKVLYPFDLESTFRCEVCSAVFHRGCLNISSQCPKCERRRKREHLPLLEAVNTKST